MPLEKDSARVTAVRDAPPPPANACGEFCVTARIITKNWLGRADLSGEELDQDFSRLVFET